MAGFWPIPWVSKLGLSVFGESILQFSKGHTGTPLTLDAATAADLGTRTLASPDVAVLAPPNRRDFYHIGVGLDVVTFVKELQKGAAAVAKSP